MHQQRADKFYADAVPNQKQRLKIADLAGKYREEKDQLETEKEQANFTLNVFAHVAYDEGYRAALKSIKDDAYDLVKKDIKIKRRKHGEFEYISSPELIPQVMKRIVKKRVNSKRQWKAWKESRTEGEHDSFEMFMLAMVVNSCFETGYLECMSINGIIKAYCGDNEEKEQLFHDIFDEVLGAYLGNEVRNGLD